MGTCGRVTCQQGLSHGAVLLAGLRDRRPCPELVLSQAEGRSRRVIAGRPPLHATVGLFGGPHGHQVPLLRSNAGSIRLAPLTGRCSVDRRLYDTVGLFMYNSAAVLASRPTGDNPSTVLRVNSAKHPVLGFQNEILSFLVLNARSLSLNSFPCLSDVMHP